MSIKKIKEWTNNFYVENIGYPITVVTLDFDMDYSQWRLFGKKRKLFLSEYFFVMEGVSIKAAYFVKKDMFDLIDALNEFVPKNLKKIEDLHEETRKINDNYFALGKKYDCTDFSKMSNNDLARVYAEIMEATSYGHGVALTTTWYLDSEDQQFSKMMIEKTRKLVENVKLNIDPLAAFSLLTTQPENSLMLKEEIESLQLLKEISKNEKAKKIFLNLEDYSKIPENLDNKLKEKIQKHFKEWRWLPFEYKSNPYEIDFFLSIWSGLLKQKADIEKELKTLIHRPTEVAKERNHLIKKLKLDKDAKRIYDIAAEIVFLKGYRKDCSFFGSYVLAQVLKEMAKRLNISSEEIYLLMNDEFEDIFVRGKKLNHDELNARKGYVILYRKAGKKRQILKGKKAKEFFKGLRIKETVIEMDVKELHGTCACSGSAKGNVKIINKVEDMPKMNKGDILVAHTTFPSLVPAMKKAAAIISEDGGMTCHAAIVAREMKTPCLTGIKNATKILKDGDYIEIDADKGIVRKIDSKETAQQSAEAGVDENSIKELKQLIGKIPEDQGIMTRDPNATLFPCYQLTNSIVRSMGKYAGTDYDFFALYFRAGWLWYIGSVKTWEDVSVSFAKRLEKNPLFIFEIEKKINQCNKKLDNYCNKLSSLALEKKSNSELLKLYEEHKKINMELYDLGLPLALSDYGDYQPLSDHVKAVLKAKLKDEGLVNRAFVILTTPDKETSLKKSENAIDKIINFIKKEKLEKKVLSGSIDEIKHLKKLNAKIEEFLKNYCWISYIYAGPEMKYGDVLLRLKSQLKKERRNIDNSREQSKLMNELKLDKKTKLFIDMIKIIVYLKPERRFIQSKGYYYIEPLMNEIGKRIGLPLSLARFVLESETKECLLANKTFDKREAEKRKQCCLHITTKDKEFIISDEKQVDAYIKKYVKIEVEPEKEVIVGTVGYSEGIIVGEAKLVETREDMEKMNEGNILVSHSTNPNLVPAMMKAAAIVTNMGGITSHAAIVSREFRIPCVIGTKNATELLKDNDFVLVDSDKGIVKRLTEQEYLEMKKLVFEGKKIEHKEDIIIEKEIAEAQRRPDLVLWFEHLFKSDIPIVGGKGANLGEMYSNFPVPNGFCLTVNAYEQFLKENKLDKKIFPLLKELDVEDTKKLDDVSKKIEQLIMKSKMSKAVEKEALVNYRKMKNYVAVRSSATAEDLPTASFAGQQATFLNIKGEKEFLKAVKQCWASLFTSRAIYYRNTNAFDHESVLISVVVQEMVDSEKAGVMFTVNPINKNPNEMIIEGSFGLGEMVVSGQVTPDTFIIDKTGMKILTKNIGDKKTAMIRQNGKNIFKELSEKESNSQSISEKEVFELAKLGKAIEQHYKKPQDIEWAIHKGKVYILQSRPITTL
ncbi:MAG: PEP/pyruvate-binding domain-containing protein [Nanoarchaeota archaeon]|nr:PEP/pyruvate-binding domain-containing protein [Nanoarchaeota archaeon]